MISSDHTIIGLSDNATPVKHSIFRATIANNHLFLSVMLLVYCPRTFQQKVVLCIDKSTFPC